MLVTLGSLVDYFREQESYISTNEINKHWARQSFKCNLFIEQTFTNQWTMWFPGPISKQGPMTYSETLGLVMKPTSILLPLCATPPGPCLQPVKSVLRPCLEIRTEVPAVTVSSGFELELSVLPRPHRHPHLPWPRARIKDFSHLIA